ncbi:MAG: NAD(P)H-dependent oxidoreductase, partial [Calditrichaeota bacterium]
FIAHDGLLISTPEYNGFFSGAFKNTIDWLSRPVEGFPPYECFDGKIAGLIAASPGSLGGVRALPHVRQQLSNVKVHVVPEQFGLSSASQAFDDENNLRDDKKLSALESVCKKLVEFTKR